MKQRTRTGASPQFSQGGSSPEVHYYTPVHHVLHQEMPLKSNRSRIQPTCRTAASSKASIPPLDSILDPSQSIDTHGPKPHIPRQGQEPTCHDGGNDRPAFVRTKCIHATLGWEQKDNKTRFYRHKRSA